MKASPAPTVSTTSTAIPGRSTGPAGPCAWTPSPPRVTTTRDGPRVSHCSAAAAGSIPGEIQSRSSSLTLRTSTRADPAVEPGAQRRLVAGQPRPDVGVEREHPAAPLAEQERLERVAHGGHRERQRAAHVQRGAVRERRREVLGAPAAVGGTVDVEGVLGLAVVVEGHDGERGGPVGRDHRPGVDPGRRHVRRQLPAERVGGQPGQQLRPGPRAGPGRPRRWPGCRRGGRRSRSRRAAAPGR